MNMDRGHNTRPPPFNGRVTNRERGNDITDVLVPPLISSLPQNRNANGQNNGSESSDSRKWYQNRFWGGTKPTNQLQIQSPQPVASCGAFDNLYNMNNPRRGRCIIFNHVNFDKNQRLTVRTGSEVDLTSIQATFQNLGFNLITYEDLKFDQIMFNLQAIANEDHSQSDCLVVFVLTHGIENQLHAFDITYKPSLLWSFFTGDKCSTLAGKPKMFFINACRGDNYDSGMELKSRHRTQVDSGGDSSYRIPNQADFLTVYSTYEGFYSWRNNKNGSCFIQALCRIFLEHSPVKDVLSMLTLVNRDVGISYESRSKDQAQNMKKQIPHVCHTLMRDVYLTPKFQSTLV